VQLSQGARDCGWTDGPTTRRVQPSGELVDALWTAVAQGPALDPQKEQRSVIISSALELAFA
jgi:hypothetical protein